MIAGIIFSLIDSEKIVIINETSGLLGSAALPIMLLTIGAKIKVRDLALKIWTNPYFQFSKLIAFPVIAYFVAKFMGLSQLEVIVAVIFASVPTCGIFPCIGKQFGGDAQLMTSIITTQVALSFITIPVIFGCY